MGGPVPPFVTPTPSPYRPALPPPRSSSTCQPPLLPALGHIRFPLRLFPPFGFRFSAAGAEPARRRAPPVSCLFRPPSWVGVPPARLHLQRGRASSLVGGGGGRRRLRHRRSPPRAAPLGDLESHSPALQRSRRRSRSRRPISSRATSGPFSFQTGQRAPVKHLPRLERGNKASQTRGCPG
ncbi:hypothetical protein NDU88_007707 [Pleurodeles waltl]|uniref:Uncharacterized protein n=1 Tax=Pleurodeles waltl TaxID=8319 RepID=A0AAV7ST91_PLEWA|nr:hypothetical protein NDU88_007707 [Pleurodeles waltl]